MTGEGTAPTQRRPLRWLPCLMAAGVLGVSVLSEAPARAPFTVCLFRNATGLPCAGCGMTRAFVALGHGRFGEAWRLHPFSPFLFAGLCLYVLGFLGRRLGVPLPRLALPKAAKIGLVAGLTILVLGWWGVSLKRHLAAPDRSPLTVRQWLLRHHAAGGKADKVAGRDDARPQAPPAAAGPWIPGASRGPTRN